MQFKTIEKSILIALIFTITISCFDFSYRCSDIRNRVFRLHILANSDSKQDQNLKLKVRDRLILEGAELFMNSENLSQTQKIAEQNLNRFCALAEQELKQNGCDYSVTATVKPCYFNTRTYDNVTLPAGVYNALQIKIGKAQGKNWWCVMYPSLCVPASTQKIDDVLEKDQQKIVENKEKYILKFKIVEWFEFVKRSLKHNVD